MRQVIYPYLSHNLVNPELSPLLVRDKAHDMTLADEWENLFNVERGGGGDPVKRKPGRPKKEAV